jgi:hypothetical protein
MDDKLPFEDFHSEGSGLLRCPNTHATSP